MKLVQNNSSENHGKFIKEILNEAEHITIAVGFLKLGGTELILPLLEERLEFDAEVEVFVGTDFFITDPKALNLLLKLQEEHSALIVYVVDQGAKTFHPKVYVGRIGTKYRSLFGSANLTGGGLNSNEEISLYVNHTINDALTTQLKQQFARYRSNKKRFHKLDQLLLRQYASRYEVNQRLKKKFEKAVKAALPGQFDLATIGDYYNRYLADREAQKELGNRQRNLIKALKVQKAICALSKPQLSKGDEDRFRKNFRDLLTSNKGRHLWGSGNIHRRGIESLEYPKDVISLFVIARSAVRDVPLQGYEKVRAYAKAVPGIGLNTLTEILCTFAPETYAVYNGNTAGALKALGILAPAHPTIEGISSERYEGICTTIKLLGERIGVKSFPDIDAFLNWVYWQTKSTKHG